MASFRVHEDQENRLPEIRGKQSTVVGIQQKRSVFGVLDNCTNRVNQKQVKVSTKHHVKHSIFSTFFVQPLQTINCNVRNETSKENTNKQNKLIEEALNKQNAIKPPPPVVPVAQFEAFKVYEDEEPAERIVRQRKLKEDDLSQVYKDTNQERFYTKREVLEMRKQKEEQTANVPKRKQALVPEDPNSPMSIEKSEAKKKDETEVLSKVKSNKDHFFEMEDYRADIYKYLREREVSRLVWDTFCFSLLVVYVEFKFY